MDDFIEKRCENWAEFEAGLRSLYLDELEKIVRATEGAQDLNLLVRLRVSSDHSKLSLAAKFGAEADEVVELLMATRQAADALGICFHVGSQAMTPFAYVQAIERVRAAIVDAAVTVDIVDVGGGFPSIYPGMEPPPLEDYFDVIHRHYEALPIAYNAELWCEPGRALSAEYSSMIVQVNKRRGEELYINDGAYGALYDAAHVAWRFPVKALEDDLIEEEADFAFYGPTCDDADYMKGPFRLPADIQAGDYIEIGMLGALDSHPQLSLLAQNGLAYFVSTGIDQLDAIGWKPISVLTNPERQHRGRQGGHTRQGEMAFSCL